LQSHLRHFEETQALNVTDNPVADEKRTIMARMLSDAVTHMKDTPFPTNVPQETWATLRGAFLLDGADVLHSQMKASLTNAVCTVLYEPYRAGLRDALPALDDLHARAIARTYIDLVQREWEVLHDMIRIQAAALEGLCEEDPAHIAVATQVLNVLREAYQQTGPLAEVLQKLSLNNAPRTAECIAFETFVQRMEQTDIPPLVATPELPDSPNIEPFRAALITEVDALFGQQRIVFLKAAYHLQSLVTDEIQLATEAVGIFRAAYQFLTNNPIECSATEAQIIQGITETLDIKINGIIDNANDFNGETASILQSFAQEKNDVTEQNKTDAYVTICHAWFAAPPMCEAGVPDFFAQCQAGAAFAPYRAEYEKHMALYNAKIEKAAIRFKRDVLLYEVTTYEEILTHSVSRLRESELENVQTIAAQLADTYAALEVLLRKNDVTPIRPEPHDIFNGKEHEVLVAEQQEGFNKGEIIKRVGSGYRYKDAVLVRANVIAAR